jgi:hypothetical protein
MDANVILDAGRSEARVIDINLSPETIALAERLAAARGISVEEAVRLAVEQSARDAGVTVWRRDASSEEIAPRAAGRARAALLERLRSQRVVEVGPWRRDDLYEDMP